MFDNSIPRLGGWHEKPDEMETINTWKWRFLREVKKGEKPKAIVLWEVTRKKEVLEHRTDGTIVTRYEPYTRIAEVPVYEIGQTRKVKAGPRRFAMREFWNIFVQYSNPNYYIWIAQDWLTCIGKLSMDRLLDHIGQEEIYGVRGNGRCTRYGGVDLDLHHGDIGIFKEQCRILLDTFHGRDGWHIQVTDQDAGGVHLLQVLPRAYPEGQYRDWLRNILIQLDNLYPDLARRADEAGMKTFKKMEIFPNQQAGLRLPFCVGRTMLLDMPLARTVYRGRDALDIEKYISWVAAPTAYMPKEDVNEYVLARLRPPIRVASPSPAAWEAGGDEEPPDDSWESRQWWSPRTARQFRPEALRILDGGIEPRRLAQQGNPAHLPAGPILLSQRPEGRSCRHRTPDRRIARHFLQ